MNSLLQSHDLSITQDSVQFATLRFREPTQLHLSNLGKEFGCDWPSTPNAARGRAPCVLWLGPEEWAIIGTPSSTVESLVERIAAGALWLVSDMSSATVQFEISGQAARALMSASCSLDWHPTTFHADHCARTLFAQIPALIHQIDDSPRYHLYVDTSFADYTRDWLLDAAGSIPH